MHRWIAAGVIDSLFDISIHEKNLKHYPIVLQNKKKRRKLKKKKNRFAWPYISFILWVHTLDCQTEPTNSRLELREGSVLKLTGFYGY